MTTIPATDVGHPRIRGVLATAVLVVLLLGIPVVLSAIAPLDLPTSLSWPGLLDGLAGPDDGTVLLRVLGLLAWVAWASVAVSVLAEVVAVVRRHPTPRIPLLGLPQRAAAALVAAVVIGLVPGRPGEAHAADLEVPLRPSLTEMAARPPSTPPQDAVAASASSAGRARHGDADPMQVRDRGVVPTVVVRPHDTLWGLAEQHLGSGLRYREIVALNKGRVQADGRRLTDPHWIYPGWVLRLPPDATGEGVRRHKPTTVRAGEEATPPEAPDSSPSPSVGSPPSAALDVDRAPNAAAGIEEPSDRIDARPAVTSSAGLPAALTEDPSRAPLVALGLGALTIAGVLAEVSRQRRGQQRSRRAGARIALPEHAARSERLLRSVETAGPTRRVRDGLALLVDTCKEHGRAVPRIALVRVNATRMELQLHDADNAPPAPFVASGPLTWTWSGDERPQPDPDRVAPCPALVSVGTDGEDLVLVNLEAAGTLRVQADPDTAAPVLTAMTTDLVSRSRAGTVTLAVTEDIPGAAALAGAAGIETIPATTAIDRVHGHAIDVAEVLRPDDVADVADARRHEVADEVWAPQVVITGGSGDATEAAAAPWSGSHVVAVGDGAGWALVPDADDSWRLHPLDVAVRPGMLRESDRPDVADLLRPAAPPERVEVADVGTLASTVLAALERVTVPPVDGVDVTVPVPNPAVPYVAVLGPVEVRGVDDALLPGRVRRATELVTYLVLHPGVGRYELDEVMWPGQRVARTTRNPFVSRARQWLGRTPDGRAYLPLVADEGEYRLLPEVGCDWYDFVRMSTSALRCEPPDIDGLVSALALIRGRPFQGVDPTGYGWADGDVQEMVSAVVDVAHVCAELLLAAADATGAARAAGDGLAVEPCSEILHCDAIRAAAARGDRAGIARAVARMRTSLEALDLGDDLLPETMELLDRLGVR